MGMPIVKANKEVGTSSESMYNRPGPLPMPTPSAPPLSILRPTMSVPRVSFREPGIPLMGVDGWRPEGSMGASSGHPATKVPIGPTPIRSSLTPLITLGFRPTGAGGVVTRGKTRPSHFQKWIKKFNGSGDPYDHLASFKQVVRVEEVSDLHVLKEGFGLTLEGKALSWFQTLDTGTYYSFETLERDFIGAFTKTGIKHSVSALITKFKEEEKESVRDCANRLRQYISRCPKEEMPS